MDDIGDTIIELAGEGVDTVRTSLSSYSLAPRRTPISKKLNYSGSDAFTGTGNALNNALLGGTGDDTLFGRGGNDVFEAGKGSDTLSGGEGLDQFVFLAVADSKPGAMDYILDFTRGQDKIVLANIDASTAITGNQAFGLDTDNSFSAGEIRQTVTGGDLLLEFNVDDDAIVEMAILLQGVTSALGASDLDLRSCHDRLPARRPSLAAAPLPDGVVGSVAERASRTTCERRRGSSPRRASVSGGAGLDARFDAPAT